MIETFEQFLQGKCCEENPYILDDMLPDFFNDWIVEEDVENIIDWGQEYGDAIRNWVLKELKKIK